MSHRADLSLAPARHDDTATALRPSTQLGAHNNLASSYQSAGRTTDAITLQEQVLADRERLLGPEHPGTRTARNNLAVMRASPQ